MIFHDPQLNKEIDLAEKTDLQHVLYPAKTILENEECDILISAKVANPYWFRLMLIMASIMIERRYKYTGSKHPLFNFFDIAQRANKKRGGNHLTAEDSALVLESVKESRAGVTGNQSFSDESSLDTAIDGFNYGMIKTILKHIQFDPDEILNS